MCNPKSKKLCGDKDCETCFSRSFASHPKAKYWSDVNDTTPEFVSKNAHDNYFFNCCHLFENSPQHINQGRWCSYCSKPPKKLCNDEKCLLCFNKSFASHLKAKYWSVEHNDKPPRQVFKNTNDKYFFNCNTCEHLFDDSLCHINQNRWCPYCSHDELCDNDDCKMCYDNSFAGHEKAKYWSNIKNGDLTPRKVFKNSNKRRYFDCDCGHCFLKQPNSVANGGWCPYCSHDELCDNDDCQMCYDNSFASHEKAKYWSYTKNGDLTPRQVFKGSSKKYAFNCDICKHWFKSDLSTISGDREHWCPFCAHQKLCDDEKCAMCYENSFASCKKAIYWSIKNKDNPRMCFKRSSNKKRIFDCPHCSKEYVSVLNNVHLGAWCSCLTNKTEAKLFDFLSSIYNFHIEKQKRFEWCKDKRGLPFDFCIEEYKLLIELDGRQHFEQVKNWESPNETRERDIYKMDCANGEGYSIIRIFQKDVWKDKNNWKIKLQDAIRMYDSPINICIGDIYKKNPFVCKIDYEDKGGWTDDEIDIIINTLLKYQSSSLKAIKNNLDRKHKIEITELLLQEVKKKLV